MSLKIIIEGKVYDTDKVPVVMVWDNDGERNLTAKHINSMKPKDGIRAYAVYPEGLNGGSIIDEAISLTQK